MHLGSLSNKTLSCVLSGQGQHCSKNQYIRFGATIWTPSSILHVFLCENDLIDRAVLTPSKCEWMMGSE